MEVSLREIVGADLQNYQKWIDEVQAKEYMSRFFPKTFHGKIDTLKGSYAWYVILVNNIAVGTVWLEKQNLQDDTVVLGILIGKKDGLSKGIGRKAIELAIENAKKKLNFSKVLLNVRTSNARAINCYKKCGFKTIKRDKKLNVDEEVIEFYQMELDIV